MAQKVQTIVDYIDIPDDLARELSDLITKQIIRERMLLQLIDEPEKYERAEEMLLPIVAKVEAIKIKITNEHVPSNYRKSMSYMWNYNGYEVDGNKIQIIEEK